MNAELQALGLRLHQSRKAAGMTQLETARMLDVSKQLVCHWELGRSEITIFNLQKTAVLYGVDVGWLLSGKKVSGSDNPENGLLANRGRVVPFLDKQQVTHFANGTLNITQIASRRHTSANCSQNSLSFNVFDSSMDGGTGKFRPADIVTVDREKLPDPGDCILVVMRKTGDVLLRRFRAATSAVITVKPPYKLVADNPSFEVIDVTSNKDVVFVGTMVEHTILRSH